MVKRFDGKPNEDVAEVMADCQTTSQMDQVCRSEFMLRQARLLEDQTESIQKQAEYAKLQARAAEETAKHTKRYTWYMLLSIIVLAGSAFLNLVVEVAKIWLNGA
jgi:hypothetical protein